MTRVLAPFRRFPRRSLVAGRPSARRAQTSNCRVFQAGPSLRTPHARAANPGGRIPRRRSLTGPVAITVDTRERYPYRFAQQPVETVRATVPAGDYAVQNPEGTILAAVERKSLDNIAATLSDGPLALQLQRLAELPLAAVVIEARYSAVFKLEHVNGNWLADQLARLHVRYPEIQVTFADSRRHAEDWTYRFLTAALADADAPADLAN